MGKIIIYRGNVPLDLDLFKDLIMIIKAEHRHDINSTDQINLSIESENALLFNVHDSIYHEGRRFKLNNVPKSSKSGKHSFSYDLVFESAQYDLIRKKMFNTDEGGFKNTLEFPLTGPIQTHLQMLVTNANREKAAGDATWVLGEYPADTDHKTLTYGNINCLQALQMICTGEDGFDIEFRITENLQTNTNTLNVLKIGQLLPYNFSYGMGKGLYKIERTLVNSNIITRLFVYGSRDNIPTSYRDYSDRLRMPESQGDYLQDQALVDAFGLIEDAVFKDDIKPTFKGIITSITGVTSSGQTQIKVDNMDFDLNEKKADGVSTKYLIPDTPAKIAVNKGNLAGYEFEIGEYDHNTKTFKINPFTDTRGLVFPGTEPTSIFKFAPGDEFTLIDIIMPDVRITEAENKLKDEGIKEYEKVSKDNVKHNLDIDPLFLEALGPETNVFMRVGDYVRLIDADFQIDKTSRITSLTRDLMNLYKYVIDIADTYQISLVQTILTDLQTVQTQVQNVTIKNKEAMLYGYKRMSLLKGLIFDPDGYFDPTNIKPGSIETGMISVGARSQQLSLDKVIFTPNLNSDKNSIQISNGTLNHFSIDDSGIKSWALNGLTQSNLLDGQSYYIYARVPRNGNLGNFLVTTQQIKFDAELSHYNFLLAVLFEPMNNMRFIELMYGATYIHGREIKTGRISSVDGLTWFDLDTGQIKGKIEFLPDSPAIQQILDGIHIGSRNLLLNSGEYIGRDDPGWLIYPLAERIEGDYTLQIWLHHTSLNGAGIGFGNENGYDGNYFYYPELKNGLLTVKLEDLDSGSNTHFCIWVNDVTNISKIKLEKGNKATDWSPAPEDIQEQVDYATAQAQAANALLADIASDNKLTPSEKQLLKKEYDLIIAERPNLINQANTYGVSTGGYQATYNNVVVYTQPLLTNLTTTSDIVGSVLRNTYNSYYVAKVNLLKAITDQVSNNIDDVYAEMDRMRQEISAEIMDVENSIINLESYVDGAFSDGIISQAEAIAIEKYINSLETEKNDLYTKYDVTINDSYLEGSARSNLIAAWGVKSDGTLNRISGSTGSGDSVRDPDLGGGGVIGPGGPIDPGLDFRSGYIGFHQTLIETINIAISDGFTTPQEKADVDSAFENYKNALSYLTEEFQNAFNAIEQKKLDGIQIGSRNLIRNSGFNIGGGLNYWGLNNNPYYDISTSATGKILYLECYATNAGPYQGINFNNYSGPVTVSLEIGIISLDVDPNTDVIRFGIEGRFQKVIKQTTNGNWVKYSVTGNVTNLGNAAFILYTMQSNEIIFNVRNIKVELGNKATDWSPAPEDVTELVNTAQTTANNAINLLTDIGSDNKLTASEKQTVANEWNRIKSEYTQNSNQAATLLVPYTAYQNAYNALNVYITPLLIDLNSTSTINGTVFRNTFKSYYDQNIAIITLIGNKQIENVSVGGRNFLKNSSNFRTSGWNGGLADNGGGYVIDSSRLYLGKPTLRTQLGLGLQHEWVKLENNKEYTYSALVYGDSEIDTGANSVPLHFWAGYNNQSEGKIQVLKWDQYIEDNNWKLIYITFKLTSNADSFRPFFYIGAGNTQVWVAYMKLERGNKATDWVPAVEDTAADVNAAGQSAAIALAEAQNAQNTAAAAQAVTSFLQTTVNGNVVATGSLLVGSAAGANGGITGVIDNGMDSVALWFGSDFLTRYTAPFRVTQNGKISMEMKSEASGLQGMYFENGNIIWRDNAGMVRRSIGWSNGFPIDKSFSSGGVLLYEFNAYGFHSYAIPDGFSPQEAFKINNTNVNETAANLASLVSPSVVKTGGKKQYQDPDTGQYIIYWEYFHTLNKNYDMWFYQAGNVDPNNNQYVGYKTSNTDKTANVPNGWYIRDTGEIGRSQATGAGQSFTSYVSASFIEGGKIIKSLSLQITK